MLYLDYERPGPRAGALGTRAFIIHKALHAMLYLHCTIACVHYHFSDQSVDDTCTVVLVPIGLSHLCFYVRLSFPLCPPVPSAMCQCGVCHKRICYAQTSDSTFAHAILGLFAQSSDCPMSCMKYIILGSTRVQPGTPPSISYDSYNSLWVFLRRPPAVVS